MALHSVLARLAAVHSHAEVLDTGVGGGPASLNYFAAIVGPSGSGKSSGASVARGLLPAPSGLDLADGLPLGSGEGLAEVYMGTVEEDAGETTTGRKKVRKVRRQVRHNAFVYVDEGQALTKMLERSGATIGQALRSAWVGATIGQANGTVETTRIVSEGTYSLGLVIGFQPDTALPLLDDAHGGTPQRFAWVWATDPSIPDEAAGEPVGALGWRPLAASAAGEIGGAGGVWGASVATGDETSWGGGGLAGEPLILAAEIREEIRVADLRYVKGEAVAEELDAHERLYRVKVAGLLALLENRRDVTVADWELSAVVWATSCRVRDFLVRRGRAATAEAAGNKRAAEAATEVAKVVAVADSRVGTLAAWAVKRLMARGPAKRYMLRKDCSGARKPYFEDAIEHAIERGWISEGVDEVLAAVGVDK